MSSDHADLAGNAREGLGSDLPQWLPTYFLDPKAYAAEGEGWAEFDFEAWSDAEYDYQADDWGGLKNIPKDPAETVRSGVGDCEDYALVALSWLRATDADTAGMAVLYFGEQSFGHAVAYSENRVFSSGRIYEMGLEAYLKTTSYKVLFSHEVGGEIQSV